MKIETSLDFGLCVELLGIGIRNYRPILSVIIKDCRNFSGEQRDNIVFNKIFPRQGTKNRDFVNYYIFNEVREGENNLVLMRDLCFLSNSILSVPKNLLFFYITNKCLD